jgi:hypothetical protein
MLWMEGSGVPHVLCKPHACSQGSYLGIRTKKAKGVEYQEVAVV